MVLLQVYTLVGVLAVLFPHKFGAPQVYVEVQRYLRHGLHVHCMCARCHNLMTSCTFVQVVLHTIYRFCLFKTCYTARYTNAGTLLLSAHVLYSYIACSVF